MNKAKTATKEPNPFKFPVPVYYIYRFFYNHPKFNMKLSRMETKRLRKKIKDLKLEKPIYVMSLARAGTTVTVEMLGKHPDVAYHKYLHMVNSFIPFWIQKIAKFIPFVFKKPVERVHKDGLLVNRDSPEAVEETIWMRFFDGIHDEAKSNVYNEKTSNPEFEEFYNLSIRKLMFGQKSSRYLSKNNYSVARLEYLLKLYPKMKIVFMARHPINHIASLVKQDKVLTELEEENKRLLHYTKIVGHREFGTGKVLINLDSDETVKKIRELWSKKETYVEGWAVYWNQVYSYLNNLLEGNKKLAEQVLILKYEDLTENSAESIDAILDFLELSKDKFEEVKKEYVEKLHQPTYYKPSFKDEEMEIIKKTTSKTAKLYGYEF